MTKALRNTDRERNRTLACSAVFAMFALTTSVRAQTEVAPARARDGGRPSVAADSMPRTTREAEAQGARHPRTAPNNPFPAASPDATTGSPERTCVSVSGFNSARSGDFLASGFGEYDQVWRAGLGTISWQPTNVTNAKEPPLVVRATRLDFGIATRVFEFSAISRSAGGNTLVYPTGAHLPTSGTWMLVATAGPNWGCFLLAVAMANAPLPPPPASAPGEVLDQVLYDFQVETVAKLAKDSPSPVYPPALKNLGLNGEVVAAFVVDTLGMVDTSTFRVLKSTNTLFSDAVRAALPNLRFEPAMIGRRKVKQLVQMPFVFAPTR